MNLLSLLGEHSFSTATFVLIKVTLLLAIAWLLQRALQFSNPRWRILLWRIVAVGTICTALFALNAPLFTLRFLPPDSPQVVATASTPDVMATNAPIPPSRENRRWRNTESQPVRIGNLGASEAADESVHTSLPSTTEDSHAKETPATSQPPQTPTPTSWSLAFWALTVWLAGIAFGSVRLLAGMLYLSRISRSAHAAPEWIELEFARLVGDDPSMQNISVRQSERITAPYSVGLLHRAILLPSSVCQPRQGEQVRAILAHEAAHFSGGDVRWNFILNLLSAVLWFHPLAWRIRIAHADACDQRCDASAVNRLGDIAGYGQQLAQIALQVSVQPPISALTMARSSNVATRIFMLHEQIGKQRLACWKTFLASATATAIILTIGAAGISRAVAQPIEWNPNVAEQETEDSETLKAINASKPAFSGRLVDETGAPVTDARIELTGQNRDHNRFLNHYETKVDDSGHYVFKAIEQADTYRVRISSIKWVGKTNWKQLPQVQLSPESAVVQDFVLPRACSVRIRTVDASGKPIGNVRIYSASLADERWGNSEGVNTDKDGWAIIGGLKPSETEYIFGTTSDEYAFGKLVLTLNNPGSQVEETLRLSKGTDVSGTVICSDGKPAAGWTIKAMPDWWHFGASRNGFKIAADGSFKLSHIAKDSYDITVSVPTGEGMFRQERAQSDVVLPPESGSLEVRLSIPSLESMTAITGKVATSGSKLTEMVFISARSENGDHRASSHVNPGEQEFRLSPLPPGQYTLTFSSTEVEQKELKHIKAPSDDLEVELQVTGKPRLVGKVVRAATKEPLTRFKIRVRKVGYLRGPNYVQDPQWQLVEDGNGEFAVEVVGPGIYQIIAAADNLAPARSERINTDDYQGEPIPLQLSSGVTLQGSVVNEQGEPVDGATVIPTSRSIVGEQRGLQKSTEHEGSVKTVEGQFALHHMATGKETLKIVHPDYGEALSQEIEIGTDDMELEPIVLKRGGTVEGIVYDSFGKPEANVTLYFQDSLSYRGGGDQAAGRLATAVTDQAGHYEVKHLPQQLCYVQRAEEWGNLGVVRTAILPVNGEKHRLDFGGKEAVTGRLLVNGKPLGNIQIQLGGENPKFGIYKAFANTDSDGNFTFWGPSDGRRTLYYRAPERRNDWIRAREVVIDPATREFGEIDVRSAELSVSLTGLPEDEANLSQVSLIEFNPRWAHGNDVGILEARAEATDPFVFQRVPPGEYELVCRRPDSLALRQLVTVNPESLQQTATMAWPTHIGTLEVSMDASICGPGGCNPPNLWSDDRRINAKLFPRDGNKVSFKNIPAGKYYLADKDIRDAPPVLEFVVKPGETKQLDLTADSYAPKPMDIGFFQVRCFTEQGVPLTGCQVTFGKSNAKIQLSSDQYGQQTFIGDPGSYPMSVAFAGYQTVHRQVMLPQVAPDGRPVGGFKVNVRLREDK